MKGLSPASNATTILIMVYKFVAEPDAKIRHRSRFFMDKKPAKFQLKNREFPKLKSLSGCV